VILLTFSPFVLTFAATIFPHPPTSSTGFPPKYSPAFPQLNLTAQQVFDAIV
jgi:hypothetical protein